MYIKNAKSLVSLNSNLSITLITLNNKISTIWNQLTSSKRNSKKNTKINTLQFKSNKKARRIKFSKMEDITEVTNPLDAPRNNFQQGTKLSEEFWLIIYILLLLKINNFYSKLNIVHQHTLCYKCKIYKNIKTQTLSSYIC